MQLFRINLKTVSLTEDINWNKLVEITDGYSGADLANVCREAALMPLRRKLLQSGGFNMGALEEMKDDINVPLSMQDLFEACKNIQKSVGQESLNEYAEWMKEFGSV